MTFSKDDIELLKGRVESRLSQRRYLHTLGVVNAAVKLAELCLPDSVLEAEAAALLHDVSKEYTLEEQYSLIKEFNIKIDESDYNSPAILHSFTAPAVIKRDFNKFATTKILSAVFNHTIGSPDMEIFDEIIFLADYIEENRTYDSCIAVRKFVFDNMKLGEHEFNIKILHRACVKAIDLTVANLLENKKNINEKNILTRNALMSKI